jgi:hypothetical protein
MFPLQNLPDRYHLQKLSETLDDALRLLDGVPINADTGIALEECPESLLAQCLALCEQHQISGSEPIRLVHQFACAGGTLMSKCIAAMPNTQLISEVDPLSTLLDYPEQNAFSPTDMVALMRNSTRGASTELIVEMFLNNLGIVYTDAISTGQRLILRDHAHSHFCHGCEIADRPTLGAIVSSKFPTLEVVFVRHPIDSYLSLQLNGWLHFRPGTFDEYCKRYIAFLRAYDGVPIIRYEDFVRSPREIMTEVCDVLDLRFSPDFIDLFDVYRLSGDSGRGSNVIAQRPRRAVEQAFSNEVGESAHFRYLCDMLSFDL